MLLEAVQAASHAAAGGAYITGTFVVDGAILLAVLKAVEFGIGKIKPRNGNGKRMPQPGAGETCRVHGNDISALNEFKTNAGESLKRIEGKVDRLLERGGK